MRYKVSSLRLGVERGAPVYPYRTTPIPGEILPLSRLRIAVPSLMFESILTLVYISQGSFSRNWG